jgi:hypothetical protein
MIVFALYNYLSKYEQRENLCQGSLTTSFVWSNMKIVNHKENNECNNNNKSLDVPSHYHTMNFEIQVDYQTCT